MTRQPGPEHDILARPRVLWPSLGRPAFTGAADPVVRALVAAPAGALDEAALRRGFLLIPVRDRLRPIVPVVGSVEASVRLPPDSPLRRALVPEGRFDLFEVRLTVPEGEAAAAARDRRSALFDLTHPALAPAPHAVVWADHGWDRFAFAFVADIHLAAAWDLIEADASRLDALDPDSGEGTRERLRRIFSRQAFLASFINPNGRWREFIGEANRMSARGELDLVVVGGDLVEYQKPANVRLFAETATGETPGAVPLEVPLLTVPGNHDYRRFPYRPQIYPLGRCGLHDLQRDHFFRHARGERRARLSLRDARAVLARDGGRHPLADYLLTIDARPDDALTLGRTRFVLLDTGRDAFREPGRAGLRRWGNYLRAVRHSWLVPACAGLRDDQAARLGREAAETDAANLIAVFHAGLTPGPESAGEDGRSRGERENGLSTILRSALHEGGRPGGPLRLEKAFSRSGFSRGGLFRNQLGLFRAAGAPGKNVLGLSGHFHHPVVLRFDRRSGALRFEGPEDGGLRGGPSAEAAVFLGAAALGLVDPRADPRGQPGFAIVEVAGDAIRSVRAEPRKASHLPSVHAFHRAGEPETLSVVVECGEPGRNEDAGTGPVDVTIVVFSRPRRGMSGGFPYRVEEADPGSVRAGDPRWIGPRERDEFFGRSHPAYIQVFRGGPGRQEFRFVPAGRPARAARAVIAVEFAAGGDDRPKPAGAVWFPLWIELGGRSQLPGRA